jgi:uncharacterized protein YqeY
MTIQTQLADELKDAMKSQDKPRRDVIRQVQTEIATAKSQPDFTDPIDDKFYQRVIGSYVKKMDKSRAEYAGFGDRGAEMASKLAFEVDYLSQWLPKKLGEEETRMLVVSAISDLGVAGDEKATGRVIGELMKNHGKDLDGGLVNRLVREEISAG